LPVDLSKSTHVMARQRRHDAAMTVEQPFQPSGTPGNRQTPVIAMARFAWVLPSTLVVVTLNGRVGSAYFHR
jgi:hypothetical protein